MMRNKNQIVCFHKTRKGMGRFAPELPESTENLENLRNILNEDSRPTRGQTSCRPQHSRKKDAG